MIKNSRNRLVDFTCNYWRWEINDWVHALQTQQTTDRAIRTGTWKDETRLIKASENDIGFVNKANKYLGHCCLSGWVSDRTETWDRGCVSHAYTTCWTEPLSDKYYEGQVKMWLNKKKSLQNRTFSWETCLYDNKHSVFYQTAEISLKWSVPKTTLRKDSKPHKSSSRPILMSELSIRWKGTRKRWRQLQS